MTDALIDDANWSDAAIATETESGGSAGCAMSADCLESSASVCDPILRICALCSGNAARNEHKEACNQGAHSSDSAKREAQSDVCREVQLRDAGNGRAMRLD